MTKYSVELRHVKTDYLMRVLAVFDTLDEASERVAEWKSNYPAHLELIVNVVRE